MTSKPGECPSFRTIEGFSPSQRGRVAHLFWEAFRGKLHAVMKPEAKALAFLERVLDPAHAISAVATDGTIVGVAGFKTQGGSFVGGELRDLQAVYGWSGGIWRGIALSLLDRQPDQDTLLMDGIMVDAERRGQGIGTALLSAVRTKAIALGCKRVRLDVVDTNPRARELYQRQGFVEQDTVDIGRLRHIFGFRTSTTMILNI